MIVKSSAKNYGEIIYLKRKTLGITREKMAHDLGTSQTTIARVELYDADIRIELMLNICDYLGLSMDKLFKRKKISVKK